MKHFTVGKQCRQSSLNYISWLMTPVWNWGAVFIVAFGWGKKGHHKHQYLFKKSAMNQSRHNYPNRYGELVDGWISESWSESIKNDNLTAIIKLAGMKTTVIRKKIMSDSKYIHFSSDSLYRVYISARAHASYNHFSPTHHISLTHHNKLKDSKTTVLK